MSTKATAALDNVPRKMLAAGEASLAKVDRKPLAEDWQLLQGKAIERAIVLACMTKQEVAYRMGYENNQAPLSRWIGGTENPQFAKLFAIEELREPLCIALAQMAGALVSTRVEFRRSA
jgi:hypothetical protein